MILSVHGAHARSGNVASTPQEAVDIITGAGFKYIELPVTTWNINPEIVTKKDIANVKELVTSSGLEVSSLGMIWHRDYTIVTSSTPEWKRNLNYANKLFDFSVAMGARVMNLGFGMDVPLTVEYFEGLKTQVKFWKEACKHAEDVGVIVAVEHGNRRHQVNARNTTKQIIDLVDAIDSPSFQINAQIAAMAYNDLDVPAAIKAMGDRIKLVHIADVPGFNPIVDRVLPLIPGKGKLDFKSILKAFKAVGYNGEICMEPSSGSPGLTVTEVAAEFSEGRKFLEAKWKQA